MPDKIDILNDVKNIEKKAKGKLLSEAVITLKKKIREIAVLKLECEIELSEIGISKEDIKRVLDFLKELPETKIEKEEVLKMQEIRRAKVSIDKDKAIREISVSSLQVGTLTGGIVNDSRFKNGYMTNSIGDINYSLCSSSGDNLEVQL